MLDRGLEPESFGGFGRDDVAALKTSLGGWEEGAGPGLFVDAAKAGAPLDRIGKRLAGARLSDAARVRGHEGAAGIATTTSFDKAETILASLVEAPVAMLHPHFGQGCALGLGAQQVIGLGGDALGRRRRGTSGLPPFDPTALHAAGSVLKEAAVGFGDALITEPCLDPVHPCTVTLSRPPQTTFVGLHRGEASATLLEEGVVPPVHAAVTQLLLRALEAVAAGPCQDGLLGGRLKIRSR